MSVPFFDRVHGMQNDLLKLRKTVAEQAARIEVLECENALLHRKVSYLESQRYGQKGERFEPAQLELLPDLPTQTIIIEKPGAAPAPAIRRARRPRVTRLPANLPTEEVVIDPDEVRQDPESYKCIGQEVTEEFDVVPPKYFRRLIIRRKFVSKLDRKCAPIVAELMPRLIPGGIASVGLVTDIVLKKFIEHQPLNRQAQVLKMQSGIELSRKTMCDWVGKAADLLQSICRHIRDDLRQSGYLQVDETPIRFCGKKGGGSGQGYLWVYNRPGGDVLFEWHPSRASTCLEGMLDKFQGRIQCDAYAAYACFIKTRDNIELHACWAHARRKIFEAKDECPAQAGWLLHQIRLLYAIERDLKGKGPALRQAIREAQSLPVLRRIEKMLRLKLARHLPKSAMGNAFQYALTLWPLLLKYVEDGRVEIDNNLVENAIRPTAIGKKNWMFVGHPDAGQRAAILYTILENCKRQGINPREYLLDVLGKLPSLKSHQTEDLTPARWAAARRKIAA